MALQTVFVDATERKLREIARDARDPTEHRDEIQRVADTYSGGRGGRTVRVYAVGATMPPWRRQGDPLYESLDGAEVPARDRMAHDQITEAQARERGLTADGVCLGDELDGMASWWHEGARVFWIAPVDAVREVGP
jgi:hypothetical protein